MSNPIEQNQEQEQQNGTGETFVIVMPANPNLIEEEKKAPSSDDSSIQGTEQRLQQRS